MLLLPGAPNGAGLLPLPRAANGAGLLTLSRAADGAGLPPLPRAGEGRGEGPLPCRTVTIADKRRPEHRFMLRGTHSARSSNRTHGDQA